MARNTQLMAAKQVGDEARQQPQQSPARKPWIERRDWFERRDY
jgi:hypothetical protein